MEHDRWSWFAGGVVVGLLIGLGIAGGFAMTKLAAARAETEEAQANEEDLRQELLSERERISTYWRLAEDAMEELRKIHANRK